MQARLLSSITLLTILSVACGGDSPSPTAPSGAALAVNGLTVSPAGAGLEGLTQFTFSVNTNATASESTFDWQFGDGSSTSGGASVSHVYARSGSFTVQVTVRNTAGQASASNTVRVTSYAGTWSVTMTGHTHYPIQRPIPITNVQLRLDQSPSGSDPRKLSGNWSDDAGCRAGNGYQSSIFGWLRDSRSLTIGVDSLFCNDGDLYLVGTPDDDLRVISGTCPEGGPDCRFVMVRQ